MNKKILKVMVMLVLILSSIIMVSAGSSRSKFKPITKKGDISKITLEYAKRQNYIARDGVSTSYPDGIVFYFVIYRLNNDVHTPTIVELRDFKINDTSYLEMTRKDNIDDIEPNTIIYNEKKFQTDENYKKVKIKTGALIEKVIICGTDIPNNGIINVDLKFGFDNKVEEFNYQFNIADIE
jgi:hypothetical protein